GERQAGNRTGAGRRSRGNSGFRRHVLRGAFAGMSGGGGGRVRGDGARGASCRVASMGSAFFRSRVRTEDVRHFADGRSAAGREDSATQIARALRLRAIPERMDDSSLSELDANVLPATRYGYGPGKLCAVVIHALETVRSQTTLQEISFRV